MPNIHTTKSSYKAPSSVQGWSWLPYSSPSPYLQTLSAAISLIDDNIKKSKSCNEAFKKLPSGREFSEIWNDSSIWISLDPSNMKDKYGATLSSKHITLTAYTLKMGKWTTAATLMHELAHVGGALGTGTDAEDILLKCLLRGLHNPNIIGQLIRGRKYNSSYTS